MTASRVRLSRIAVLMLFAALGLCLSAARAEAAAKPRMILMRDGEVDSFIRYLYYSNEVDTAGIVYTSRSGRISRSTRTAIPRPST